MTNLACRNFGVAVALAALVLPTVARAGAVPPATCGFNAEVKVRLGNGSEFDGNLGANAEGGRVLLGRKVLGGDGTLIEATNVGLGVGSSVFDVDATNLQNAQDRATVRGTETENVDLPIADPYCPIPEAECGGENVDLSKGDDSRELTPGVYGEVAMANGTTLRLAPGEYTFCGIKTGRRATILVTGGSQSTINVTGNFEIGNSSVLRAADGTPTPILNVGGSRVRVGAGGEAQACVSAPGAHVSLGRGSELTGAVCSETLSTSRNVSLDCSQDCVAPPPTTTTTSPTTSTSSTSTSTTTTTTTTVLQPFCGDGMKNRPEEECDGEDFGGATCETSPGGVFVLEGSPVGSLLCTNDCLIDRSNCDGTTTTTILPTTTTIASTSTTVAPTSTTIASTSTTVAPTSTTIASTSTTVAPTSTTIASTSTTVAPTSTTIVTTTSSSSSTSTSTSSSSTSTSSTSTSTSSTSTSTSSTSTSTSSTSTSTSSTSTSTSSSSTSTTSTSTSTTTSTTVGMPAPTAMDLTVTLGGGVCGETRDGSNNLIKSLTCGGLSIGGGSGNTVQEGLTPPGSTNRFALSCTGSSCTISGSATGVATTTRDCTSANCFFGTPLPIPNGAQTTCVVNRFAAPASGTIDIATGVVTDLSIQLASSVRVTGQSNVGQPCPVCTVAGTPSPTNPLSGTCSRGLRAGLSCTTTNPTGLSKDCLPGGADASVDAGTIAVNLTPLTTGTRSVTNATGAFCMNQTTVGCFGSSTCRTITENGTPAGALSTSVAKPIKLASTFCIPTTTNALVNFAARLPGPGALSLIGDLKLIQ